MKKGFLSENVLYSIILYQILMSFKVTILRRKNGAIITRTAAWLLTY